MTNLDAAPEMLLPGPTGLFHCTGLPPALGPWTAHTISRTPPQDPSPLWILPTGLQPLQGPHLHLPISHRSAGAALWLHLGSLAHLAPP